MIEILVTDRLGVVEIQFEHVITIYSLSMIFYQISVHCFNGNTEIFMIDKIEIQPHLLILPESSNDEMHDYLERNELCYDIDSDWCEVDQKNNLLIPKLRCRRY